MNKYCDNTRQHKSTTTKSEKTKIHNKSQ